MYYVSTRDKSVRSPGAAAILQGISADGGLFVPESLPQLTTAQIRALCGMDYAQRAAAVFALFLDDYTEAELTDFAKAAYNTKGFDTAKIAPLTALQDNTWMLELWHGPTAAFKDMALQMLPQFLTGALQKTGEKRQVLILTATSGDTGSAALDGFADVPGVKILTFYPQDGISEVQKLQMVTQAGANVGVYGVRGNFDDVQSEVKRLFGDLALQKKLNERGVVLSAANSINWGRLLPQIVYYVSAYCDLVKTDAISLGDTINAAVPTGNFGNILAAFYAKQMGLPLGKLICASNENAVLTDWLRTGTYDRKRPFHLTLSPAMDILVSSNVERLLFALSGGNDAEIRGYMQALGKDGRYTVSPAIKAKLNELFWADFISDAETLSTIAAAYNEQNYLLDSHTAVAYAVLAKYRSATNDPTPTVLVSTASPYKFCDTVLKALGHTVPATAEQQLDALQSVTGVTPPKPMLELRGKVVRFGETLDKNEMERIILDFA